MVKSYQELINAVKEAETQENINNLYLWFEKFGSAYFLDGGYVTAKELDGRNLYLLFTDDRKIVIKLLTEEEYHETDDYKEMMEYKRKMLKKEFVSELLPYIVFDVAGVLSLIAILLKLYL